jgi:hypothetical protein
MFSGFGKTFSNRGFYSGFPNVRRWL